MVNYTLKNKKEIKISIVGMGYVGLPLFMNFFKKFHTIGFDINRSKITQLRNGIDPTLQYSKKQLKFVKDYLTYEANDLLESDIYIITVPTPITKNKKPNLEALRNASIQIGSLLRTKSIVVYESTVFPGCTEEVCIPLLEKYSKLKANHDFYVGYSPERVNPGDNKRTLNKIDKLVASQDPSISNYLMKIYSNITNGKVHIVKNIKTAEAAKIIENTQRDLNIALVNEFMQIFDKMDIDIHDVLKAAATKWNFNLFQPGLVGGHCIGVDPYYLSHASIKKNHQPKLILSGREINESMPKYLFKKIYSEFDNTEFKNFKILVIGLTFKENCPDFRNSKSLDFLENLSKYNKNTFAYDPFLKNKDEIVLNKKIKIIWNLRMKINFDLIIILVPHIEIKNFGLQRLKSLLKKNGKIFDFKNIFNCPKSNLFITS